MNILIFERVSTAILVIPIIIRSNSRYVTLQVYKRIQDFSAVLEDAARSLVDMYIILNVSYRTKLTAF